MNLLGIIGNEVILEPRTVSVVSVVVSSDIDILIVGALGSVLLKILREISSFASIRDIIGLISPRLSGTPLTVISVPSRGDNGRFTIGIISSLLINGSTTTGGKLLLTAISDPTAAVMVCIVLDDIGKVGG